MNLIDELNTLPKRELKFNRELNFSRFNKGLMGGITDGLGLTDYSGQERRESAAQKSADAARNASLAISKESIAFQREQYNEWQSIYGPIQEQLAAYYSDIDTANKQVVAQLQDEASSTQAQETALQAEFAQRGISGSGIEAAAMTNMATSSAQNRAGIRSSAEEIKAQNQMNFLGLGLGQGTQMLSVNQAASSAGANTQMSGANSLNSVQTAYGNMQNQARMNTMSTLGGVGSSAIAASDRRLKKNIKLIGNISGINFYVWTWNKKANKLGLYGYDYGVIAQEVKKKYRVRFKGTKYIGVNYSKLLGDL